MIVTRLAAASLAFAALASCSPCDDRGVNFSDTCLPAKLGPDSPLDIELREACGSSCSEAPQCTALLDLNVVTIIAAQSECLANCTPTGACQARTVRCMLPTLAPGQYTVVIPGLPSRQLLVESGAALSCSFGQP